jgi:hypothetical protein
MARYKLLEGGGVQDTVDGGSIPPTEENRHWRKYLRWLDEGNMPDPAFTQEELDQQAIREEFEGLKTDLRNGLTWQFRIILELFEVGKAKGIWDNADFTTEVKQKAAAWKTKLDRLIELGDA